MATVNRFAVADSSNSGWAFVGGETTLWQTLKSEGYDPQNDWSSPSPTVYLEDSDTNSAATGKMIFHEMPPSLNAITAVQVRIARASGSAKNQSGFLRLRWYKSDGTTPLTAEATSNAAGSLMWAEEVVTFTLTGGTTQDDWRGAILQFTSDGDGDTEDPPAFIFAWCRAEFTYTETATHDPIYTDCGDHLVGHWLADGLDVRDRSVYQNHGEIVGNPPVVASRFGPVYDFSGTNDYVEIPNDMALLPMGGSNGYIKWSGGCWVKTDTVTNLRMISMMGTPDTRVWYFLFISTNQMVFSLRDNQKTDQNINWRTNDDLTSLVADGEWHHIAFSYNGTLVAGAVDFYVDGALQTIHSVHNPADTGFSTLHESSAPLHLGVNFNASTSGSPQPDGEPGPQGMWDVRLYSDYLEQEDWEEIINQTMDGPNDSVTFLDRPEGPKLWLPATMPMLFGESSPPAGDSYQSLFPGKTSEGGSYILSPDDLDTNLSEARTLGNDSGSTSTADDLTGPELKALLDPIVEPADASVVVYGMNEINGSDAAESVFAHEGTTVGSTTLSDVQNGDLIRYFFHGWIDPNTTSDDFMIRFHYDGYDLAQFYMPDTALGGKPFILEVEVMVVDIGTQSSDGILVRSYVYKYSKPDSVGDEVFSHTRSETYNLNTNPVVDITAEVVSGGAAASISVLGAYVQHKRAFGG